MIAFANSDRGLRRRENQDRYTVKPLPDDSLLLAVFDGMGGEAAGGLAAEVACESFERAVEEGFCPGAAAGYADLLRAATTAAEEAIARQIRLEPALAGMGTTVTAALLSGGVAYVLNVGDSRTYLFREGMLSQLTRDDSYVQHLLERGVITQTEALSHPNRNYITRALGALGEAQIPVSVHALCAGDRLLLCSDGLHGMLGEGRIRKLLGQNLKVSECVGYLIAAANEAGGCDNVTVALVRV